MNRRNKIKTVLTFAVVAIAMVAMAASAGAAELTERFTDMIMSYSTGKVEFSLSVYPGKTFYSGTGDYGDVSGDFNGSPGEMYGYRLFNDGGGSLVTIAQSDPNDGGYGLIGPATGTVIGGNKGYPGAVWTTSDPDVNSPDFSNTDPNSLPSNFVKLFTATGTINISRLSSGIVYLIWGGYKETTSVDLTMSGTGQPDLIILDSNEHNYYRDELFVSGFDFTGAGDYETITYTVSGTEKHARFLGVVIDGMDKYAPSMTMVDKATWSGESVAMSPDVVINDPNGNSLEFAWTAEPADGVVFSDPTIENPTVTITKSANTGDATAVTITLAANNVGSVAATDSLTIDVYDDACEMAKTLTPETANLATDFNKNCVTGLDDIAIMAVAWLADYTALEAFAKP